MSQPWFYDAETRADEHPDQDRPEYLDDAALVEKGMEVVKRLLDERQLERDLLSKRCYEWMHHPLGRQQWRENLDLFIAGYRLGTRGAERLSEPYWTEKTDEDGTYTEGPKP